MNELIVATGGTVSGSAPQSFSGISIDTRTIAVGDIFVAIKGDRVDGHDYVASALQKGAGIAIVSRVDDEMREAGPLLLVPGTPLEALEALGCAAREVAGQRCCGYGQRWQDKYQRDVVGSIGGEWRNACFCSIVQQSLGCAFDTCAVP